MYYHSLFRDMRIRPVLTGKRNRASLVCLRACGTPVLAVLVAAAITLCLPGCGSDSGGTTEGISGSTPGLDVIATVTSTGPNPLRVAVNSVTNRVYVGGMGDNSSPAGNGTNVTVIDGATNSVTAKLTNLGGYAPEFLVVNPSSNRVFVGGAHQAAGAGSSLAIIDGNTNAVSNLPTGAGSGATVNPATNRLYLSGTPLQNDVVALDQNTLTQLADIVIGPRPGALAVNSVTNRVYAASDSGMSVIDGATNAVLLTIPGRPLTLAVNPATNRIYTTDESGAIKVVDGSSNTVLTTLQGIGGGAIGVDTQANRIYAAGRNGLSVIDGATNTVLKTISIYPVP